MDPLIERDILYVNLPLNCSLIRASTGITYNYLSQGSGLLTPLIDRAVSWTLYCGPGLTCKDILSLTDWPVLYNFWEHALLKVGDIGNRQTFFFPSHGKQEQSGSNGPQTSKKIKFWGLF